MFYLYFYVPWVEIKNWFRKCLFQQHERTITFYFIFLPMKSIRKVKNRGGDCFTSKLGLIKIIISFKYHFSFIWWSFQNADLDMSHLQTKNSLSRVHFTIVHIGFKLRDKFSAWMDYGLLKLSLNTAKFENTVVDA